MKFSLSSESLIVGDCDFRRRPSRHLRDPKSLWVMFFRGFVRVIRFNLSHIVSVGFCWNVVFRSALASGVWMCVWWCVFTSYNARRHRQQLFTSHSKVYVEYALFYKRRYDWVWTWNTWNCVWQKTSLWLLCLHSGAFLTGLEFVD